MTQPSEKRFEDFFLQDEYVKLKNYLYNYRLRKRLIEGEVARSNLGRALEVGSGLSPILTDTDDIVYSELSYRALRTLKASHGRGAYVVADGTSLPFKDAAFTHTICSEVIEHVEDDQQALCELARVMSAGGTLCLTVPHRKFYFAADDRFVHHFRRYELDEVMTKLTHAGLRARYVRKVLGPLEKVTMYATIKAVQFLRLGGENAKGSTPGRGWILRAAPLFKWANRCYAVLAWIDAQIMPRALATVIYVNAGKAGEREADSTE